jgi:hypothetical protein
MGTNARRSRGLGSLGKKRGSKFWYGFFYQNGRQRSVSLRTEVKKVAEERLRDILLAVKHHEQLPTDIDKITYENLRDSLLQDYQFNQRKSLYKGGLTSLTHLDRFFAGCTVPKITTDRVNAFKAERLNAGAAHGTINRSLAALKRMSSWLFKRASFGLCRTLLY